MLRGYLPNELNEYTVMRRKDYRMATCLEDEQAHKKAENCYEDTRKKCCPVSRYFEAGQVMIREDRLVNGATGFRIPMQYLEPTPGLAKVFGFQCLLLAGIPMVNSSNSAFC